MISHKRTFSCEFLVMEELWWSYRKSWEIENKAVEQLINPLLASEQPRFYSSVVGNNVSSSQTNRFTDPSGFTAYPIGLSSTSPIGCIIIVCFSFEQFYEISDVNSRQILSKKPADTSLFWTVAAMR